MQLGFAHPDDLLAALSHRQLEEWIAFSEIEPWGQLVDDHRTALMMWAAIQPHSRKAVSLQKLLPQWGPPKPVDPAAYRAKARALLEAAGAAAEAQQLAQQQIDLLQE